MPSSLTVAENKGRLQAVDLVKIVAMMLVIGAHTADSFIHGNKWSLGLIFYRSCIGSIPLFFMASGYLLLGRSCRSATFRYSLRKDFGIVRFVLIVSAIVVIIQSLSLTPPFFNETFARLLSRGVAVFTGSFMQHGPLRVFWYFGAMLIIYLIYPLINTIYNRTPTLYIWLLAGVATVAVFFFFCNIFPIVKGKMLFEAHIPQPLRVWIWMLYFSLGGMIRRFPVRNIPRGVLWGVLIITGLLNLLQQHWLMPRMGTDFFEYFYGSPVTIMFVVAIFVAIFRIDVKDSRSVATMASLLLTVYALHPFVIDWMCKLGFEEFALTLGDNFGVLVFYPAIVVATFVVAYLLMRLPFVARIARI